jgi:hypothetical protein
MSSQKIIVKKFRKRLRTPVIRGTDEQFKLALNGYGCYFKRLPWQTSSKAMNALTRKTRAGKALYSYGSIFNFVNVCTVHLI